MAVMAPLAAALMTRCRAVCPWAQAYVPSQAPAIDGTACASAFVGGTMRVQAARIIFMIRFAALASGIRHRSDGVSLRYRYA